MAWRIRFIPNEVASMTVNIEGVHALDWNSAEGDCFKTVPAPWTNVNPIRGHGDGNPNGRNAHMQVWWDDHEMHNMSFDNGENFDVSH